MQGATSCVLFSSRYMDHPISFQNTFLCYFLQNCDRAFHLVHSMIGGAPPLLLEHRSISIHFHMLGWTGIIWARYFNPGSSYTSRIFHPEIWNFLLAMKRSSSYYQLGIELQTCSSHRSSLSRSVYCMIF